MGIDRDLYQRLTKLEMEQKRQEDDVDKLVEIATLPKTDTSTKVNSHTGYTVCLVFGSGAPVSEWSDETHGWRSRGLGSRYTTEQRARQKLTELKRRWPEYPLEVSD
ncbi:MAG: hypothetical protein BWK79_07880 [Beggiatoa sp. IS2]|nr:MAG: hypothetical protein BWK79_07880 [Beggiatoa sp. IS2]